MKRQLQIAIISDIHLGTYSCQATELLQYLESIQPETLIINGDFINISDFKKVKFPPDHLKVIKQVMKMAEAGTKVVYIIGNHDDILRRYVDFTSGNISLRNKMVFQIDGKSYWVFHGDVFDASLKFSPMIARLGGKGYRMLIFINRFINKIRARLGKPYLSIAKNIKLGLKNSLEFITEFEQIAIKLAEEKQYDHVICGHIHRPTIKQKKTASGKLVTYLNAGDWVENLTALEFRFKKWSIYQYNKLDFKQINPKLNVSSTQVSIPADLSQEELFEELLERAKKEQTVRGSAYARESIM